MIFDPSTVAIGIFTYLGQTSFSELKTTVDLRGRVFDQIVFVKDVPVNEQQEWYDIAMVVTVDSVCHQLSRITLLKR